LAHIFARARNNGEVAAEIVDGFPQRLTASRGFVGDGRQTFARGPLDKACWLSQNHPGKLCFTSRLYSIDDAEKFRGQDVFLPIEKRVSLPAGHTLFQN